METLQATPAPDESPSSFRSGRLNERRLIGYSWTPVRRSSLMPDSSRNVCRPYFVQNWGIEWLNVPEVDCCSNHTITRISIQTAGLAFGGTGLCFLSCWRCWWQSCRAFNCRISYGRYSPTVILIIIGIPSPTHVFIPGSKPPFSAYPSHRSLSFSSSGLTTRIPQTIYCYFWAYPFLLFSFSVLNFLVVGFVR